MSVPSRRKGFHRVGITCFDGATPATGTPRLVTGRPQSCIGALRRSVTHLRHLQEAVPVASQGCGTIFPADSALL